MKKLLVIALSLIGTYLVAQPVGGGTVGVPISNPSVVFNSITLWSTNGTTTTISDINSIGSTMTKGQFLILSAGTYTLTNFIVLPPNGGIMGAGIDATILIGKYTNDLPTPAVMLNNNSVCSGMTISNYFQDVIPEVYSACFGIQQGHSLPAYTNATLYGVKMWGGSDGIYNRHTNTCSLSVYNSIINGRWDLATFVQGTHEVKFYNCSFTNLCYLVHSGQPSDIFYTANSATCNLLMINCILYSARAVNGEPNNSYLINFASATASSSAHFINTSFYSTNVATVGNGLIFTDTSIPMQFDNCLLNTTQLGDDLTGAEWAIFGTNNVRGIQFGGNLLDGFGPQIYSTGPGDSVHIDTTVLVDGDIQYIGSSNIKEVGGAGHAITFPNTTVNFTNTTGYNIDLYISNVGVTGTAIKKNGTTIGVPSTTGVTQLQLSNGDYFSETYTVGTPTAIYWIH